MTKTRNREAFWVSYIEEYLLQDLQVVISGYPDDGTTLNATFTQLDSARPEEVEEFLIEPREWLASADKALQTVIREHGLAETSIVPLTDLKFKLTGIPEACRVPIGELRANDRGKLLLLDGQVRSVKAREEILQVGVFECGDCRETVNVVQEHQTVREPGKCYGCRAKGRMKHLPSKSIYANVQEVLLQEQIEDLDNGAAPKQVVLRLVEDHIDVLQPGDRVTVTGIYGGEHEKRSRSIKAYVDVTGLKKKGDDLLLFKPTRDFEESAQAFAANNPISTILDAACGDIYGHDFIKAAVLVCIVGGVRRKRPNGSIRRGDSHILIVGDPGLAKTQILRLLARIAPRIVFVSGGSGTSKAGLTAAAVKDEFGKSGGYAIEAGAMVLANGGNLFIDEFDKMTKDDRAAMHEGMQDQTITFNKANLHAVLFCQCGIGAAANPKMGRFDPSEPLLEQFDIPDSLASRFDLIIPMVDRKHRDNDAATADHLMELELAEKTQAPTDLNFIRQYIAYIKRLEPALTREAMSVCGDYYKTIRAAGENVTVRQQEGLWRMMEAHAKLHLRKEVVKADAEFAVSMHKQYISLVGRDPISGEMDLGMVSGLGHTLGQEGRAKAVIAAVRELAKGQPYAKTHDVMRNVTAKGLTDEQAEKTIKFLIRNGKLYEKGGGGTLALL